MEIKAKSTYNLETMQALIRLYMFKKANPRKRMVIYTVLFTGLIAIDVLEMIIFGNNMILSVLLVCCVLWYLLLCYWFFLLPRIRYNALAKMKNVTNEYTFRDASMLASSTCEEFCGQSEIQYALLIKAMETQKYLFLFQNRSQVIVVDKSTITGGTVDEIRQNLRSRISGKYIICRY